MEIGTNPDYDEAFAAALDWWREAGVGNAFQDEPRSWLPQVVEPAKPNERTGANNKAPPPVDAPILAPPVESVSLPGDLDAFRTWWLNTPALDGGRVAGRVAPRGEIGSELMIVAPMPEGGDRESLMSGSEGKLLDLFLTHAGVAPGAVYFASALPCHAPAADWTPEANPLLASALRHHVALAHPRRLLVVGLSILPLLRHASAQGPAVSSVFNHEGGTVPMLAVRRIPAQASQPRWKCILWQAWLDWTA